MTTILDRLNSDDDDDDLGKTEQLEKELKNVQTAFDEYIATTQVMEGGMEKELNDLQDKLKQSKSTNGALEKKTKNLELSLKNTNEKLKVESMMRKQAEMASLESESRYEPLQAKSRNKNLQVESSIQIRHVVERNDSLPLRIVDSGVITEMVSNTSQTIRGQLDYAKQKLKRTEDQLEKSQSLVKELEKSLEKIDIDNASNNNNRSSDDKALLRELQEIKAEIDAARSEIQSECTSTFQRDVGREHPHDKELIEANSMLREEVSCLREILYEQDVVESTTNDRMISKVIKEAKEEHDQEMDAFREQFEKVTNENTILQSKAKKFENERISSSNVNNDEIDMLKEEIDRINDELQTIHDEHERAIDDTEEFWRNEIKKKGTTKDVIKQKENECSEMRYEILALTESLYDARQRNSNITNELSAMERHSMSLEVTLQNNILDSKDVIEVKEKENARLEDNLTSAGEEVRILSQEISQMSIAFNKTQEDYNAVVAELDIVHDLLKNSRKEAETNTKQNEIQRFTISSKLSEIEDEKQKIAMQLEKAASDNALLQNKLDEGIEKIIKATKTSDRNIDIDSSQDEQKVTMDTLERINRLLASVDFMDQHHKIQLQSSRSNVNSTTLKAEEIRQKVAFLIYALQKSKKEHSDVLLQLKFLKESNSLPSDYKIEEDVDTYNILQKQNEELQRKVDEIENTLAEARDSKIPHAMEKFESESAESETEKCAEKKAEISLLRNQFTKLFRKNENIAQKVKETESEILSFRKATKARADVAKELQNGIDRAVGEAKRRNQEIDELTITMENRMNLAEESLEMVEKEVSIAVKSLKNSQLVLNEESESISSMLDERRLETNLDRCNRIDPISEEHITQSGKPANKKDEKGTNEWLVHKYQNENDEKVKAAIAATMTYVFAADKGPTKNKRITSAQSPFEDTDIHIMSMISETSQSLKSNFSTSYRENKINNEGQDSSTPTLVSTDDSNTKRDVNGRIKLDKSYEGLSDKIAEYHRTLTFAEQVTENESRGDFETEERE